MSLRRRTLACPLRGLSRAAVLVGLAGCDDLFNLERLELVDGGEFDPSFHCRDYPLQLAPGSYYRLIESPMPAWSAHDDCNDDALGYTHLAVLSSREELDTIREVATQRGVPFWWVGAVQPITATTPEGAWIWVTGTPLGTSQWATLPVVEPNDDESNHAEQFATVSPGFNGLADYMGAVAGQALCECDGQPVVPAADMAVDQSRQQ